MKYHTYSSEPKYPLIILATELNVDEYKGEFLDRFQIPDFTCMLLDLHQAPGKKKTPAKEIKEYVDTELLDVLKEQGAKYVVVTNGDYFKYLSGQSKTEANLGYVLDSPHGDFKVVYAPSVRQIFHAPETCRAKIAQAMDAVVAHTTGKYQPPGHEIIKYADYPVSPGEIKTWLDKLLEMDCDLTCDIEAFDLKHYKAGIGTITFCWNKHEGIAFPVDYVAYPLAVEAPYGYYQKNDVIRQMLGDFFRKFQRKMIYHNIAYDVYNLIYQLFMDNLIDTEGLLQGIDVMLKNWDCTKLITYLATNSCSGNHLGLKAQSQEFSGNYAIEEIHDITCIPLMKLLEYNLIDGLSTWYVYEKNKPIMIADQQEEIYETLFKPSNVDIIQMQLTGMPVNMTRVKEVEVLLYADEQAALEAIHSSKIAEQFTYHLNEEWVRKRNEKLKKKRVTLADANEKFNPASTQQLSSLLYEMLGLPIIAKTKSKQPACGSKTLKALKTHTQDAHVLEFLDAMLDYSAVTKIISSFLPSLLNAQQGPDGWHYVFGNFNLGGTLSGRLSSSDPNMQNLPAKSKYAKLIKSCFQAPPGWLFCGLDFASLEDRISALTTKDPMKLKVYTDGFDGHCLRAYTYWPEQMPDIDGSSKDSINSIQKKYGYWRDLSKAPTFAMTYQGTYVTLMKNCGFSKEQAIQIVDRFRALYKVSIDWVEDQLKEAGRTGYITAAFGLRIRTPLLAQTLRGTSKTPQEAEAEGRSAGNALGQSWCLLNNRASAEFMGVVRKSEHRLNVRPCAHIHDAQYMMVRNELVPLMFVNEHLVKAVEWQEHPAIAHPEVKLGGELSVFYPTWNDEVGIPNRASKEKILEVVEAHNNKVKK